VFRPVAAVKAMSVVAAFSIDVDAFVTVSVYTSTFSPPMIMICQISVDRICFLACIVKGCRVSPPRLITMARGGKYTFHSVPA